MSFLFPAFLFGALAAAVPILLHFFARDRARRLAFSDVRFLERAFVRRDRRRRLRELLLLALRVAALLLLAVAFARPFLDAAGGSGRITVVAVDRSLSLSAPGQMALARERALEAVAATPPDESVAVVAFDDAAEVVAGPAAGRAPVRAAIERIRAGGGGDEPCGGSCGGGRVARWPPRPDRGGDRPAGRRLARRRAGGGSGPRARRGRRRAAGRAQPCRDRRRS